MMLVKFVNRPILDINGFNKSLVDLDRLYIGHTHNNYTIPIISPYACFNDMTINLFGPSILAVLIFF